MDSLIKRELVKRLVLERELVERLFLERKQKEIWNNCKSTNFF